MRPLTKEDASELRAKVRLSLLRAGMDRVSASHLTKTYIVEGETQSSAMDTIAEVLEAVYYSKEKVSLEEANCYYLCIKTVRNRA